MRSNGGIGEHLLIDGSVDRDRVVLSDRYNESIQAPDTSISKTLMDAVKSDRSMTVKDDLAWEASQDIRDEFINGAIGAMTGGVLCHNDLTVKLIYENITLILESE